MLGVQIFCESCKNMSRFALFRNNLYIINVSFTGQEERNRSIDFGHIRGSVNTQFAVFVIQSPVEFLNVRGPVTFQRHAAAWFHTIKIKLLSGDGIKNGKHTDIDITQIEDRYRDGLGLHCFPIGGGRH